MTRSTHVAGFGLLVAALAGALLAVSGGCGDSKQNKSGERPPEESSARTSIKLTSPAFDQGATIPAKYTGEGDDISPPLAWSELPEGTQELALICDDPDAPSRENPGPEPWVHWVIYRIPADADGLPEGVPRQKRLDKPAGAVQGANSFSGGTDIGYGGPMPPAGSGPHRYFFKLYALDTKLDLEPGLSKDELLEAMKGHELAKGELMGTYEVPE
jgi:Raf kinase inhibitor-like YbhB/YbcL family protein